MSTVQKPSKPIAAETARSIVLGTAGHIDHGKTALVFALTGTDTDRLPEEKSRGITIDLGFAALSLTDDQGRTLDLSLIDVPGHQAFIRNMLAGAGGIDCVLLVIAADEGVKAQTAEHLAICSLLGIRLGVIALTKLDVVSAERLREVRKEIAHFVEGTFLEGAAVVAVSARTRQGIPELKEQLVQLIAQVPARSTDFVSRLPLDRAFTVRGFGTVVTGTLQSGALRVGDTVELQPRQRAVRVRGLQTHGQARGEVHAAARVAVNLGGIEVAEVKRGDVLVPPGTLDAVTVLDADLTMLPDAPALKHRSRVRVHAFTSDALATVLLYPSEAASKGATTLVRLRLAKPMVLVPGDRFVVRQASPAATLGGGSVLDANPLPRVRKTAAHDWLQRLKEASAVEKVLLRVQRRGLAGTSLAELVRETGLTLRAIRKLIAPLLERQVITAEGTVEDEAHLLASEFLVASADLLLIELSRSKTHGLTHAELRSKTKLNSWVFDLAVKHLQQQRRIAASLTGFCLPGPRPVSDVGQQQRLAEIEAIYAAAGLASPILSEVAAQLQMAQKELSGLITILLRGKRLVRMGADNLFIHEAALARLTAQLQQHRGENFDVSRFKNFTNLTRKHAIPLLEYLDGARVTRNNNGMRTVL